MVDNSRFKALTEPQHSSQPTTEHSRVFISTSASEARVAHVLYSNSLEELWPACAQLLQHCMAWQHMSNEDLQPDHASTTLSTQARSPLRHDLSRAR